jgi:predicted anti-sigma-YlaC factor YlaD
MGEETVRLVEEQHAKTSYKLISSSTICIHCGVASLVCWWPSYADGECNLVLVVNDLFF